MKATRLLLSILLSVLCSGSAAWGQQTGYKPIYAPPSPSANAEGETTNDVPPAAPGSLSDWIVYRRDCCEGRHGLCTPLYTEVYLRSGPSFPVGGMTLSRELQTGWSIAGGARFMLFNEPLTRAWVVDAHLINTNEAGNGDGTSFPISITRAGVREDFGTNNVPGGVTVKNSNRAMAGIGLGREWYPWQPADFEGRKGRVGADFGGRYGTHNLSLNETRRITDVIGAVYAAVHADVEFPCRNVMFHTGVRLEWAYTWSDILQRTSDVQDINLFLTFGVRY